MSSLSLGIVIGQAQSNEQGPGAYTAAGQSIKFQSHTGYPVNDLDGNGARNASAWRGTIWTQAADLLRVNQGIHSYVLNAAVGGTSAVDHWCGMLTAWQGNGAGFGVLSGEWIAPTAGISGRKYKRTVGGAHDTSEPTYNTTIGGTTADGSTTLTAFASDSNDVVGTIYKTGQSGYDPLGYVATLLTRIDTMKSLGFDKVIVIMGGGQAECAGRYKTAQQVAQAKINITDHLLSLHPDIIVLHGDTFYWNTNFEGAPYFRSYDVIVKPAVDLVLEHYVRENRVQEGLRLFQVLGKNIDFVANDTDNIHAGPNSLLASKTEAARKILQALVNNGVYRR